LFEQHNDALEGDPRMHRIQVVAGHVEIVGDKKIAPRKLLTILQEQGTIAPVPADRKAAFDALTALIYQLRVPN
jgi:hypothetical protein